MVSVFAPLMQRMNALPSIHKVGRVSKIAAGVMNIEGLSAAAAIGDGVWIGPEASLGEVVGIDPEEITVLAEAGGAGFKKGTEVLLGGPVTTAPSNDWIGRVIDPLCHPLDNRPLFPGPAPRLTNAAPPSPGRRRRLGKRLSTGTTIFDTLLPIVRGQRIGLFAGSGVGKSTLLGSLAQRVMADVVVIALVGERGRELREFVETTLGEEGLARSVVVAATSDQSALVRKRCLSTATTIAEHFRDQGLEVLLLVDSVTRFAEAHREVALAAGEAPSLKGYPPSVQSALMAMAERAGPGCEDRGSITAIYSVLVPGSDMEEPVADILRGVLDGHVVLDRKIAERGRFPAVDILRSVSRSLPWAATTEQNEAISAARNIIATWENSEMMVQAGLYHSGSDPAIDRAIHRWPALEKFLSSQTHDEGIDGSFRRLYDVLKGR
ncbi:FliI/YscN family ATPase [Thioclava sp. FR2]|uniref:FliI/YscN family ATPase n=1 Tax=Thioclava sp. FR2 TaxID=3445780 RepID=UPI003EB7EB41